MVDARGGARVSRYGRSDWSDFLAATLVGITGIGVLLLYIVASVLPMVFVMYVALWLARYFGVIA